MLSVMRTENFGIKHHDGHDELDDIQTSGTGGRQRKIKMTRSGVSLGAEQKMQLIGMSSYFIFTFFKFVFFYLSTYP
jgi:hypothetical protein